MRTLRLSAAKAKAPSHASFLSRKLGPGEYANVRYATRRSRPHVKTRSIARPNVGYEHSVMKEKEGHEERSGSDRRDKDNRQARHASTIYPRKKLGTSPMPSEKPSSHSRLVRT